MNDIAVNVVDQMKADYAAYSIAVILGRAIPCLYDGLRPATRRILQTMIEQGLHPEKPFVKCARICGMTTAWYHTHGSPYGSLIDMAAEWKNNVPWVWAHGNVGSSVDGAASERYVEAKLRPAAVDILLQYRETWETRDNYDASRQEAIRFNSVIPTVLLNGIEGIGVGLATRVAPHNLRAVVEATKLLNKPNASPIDIKKARNLLVPDFPTGCDVVDDAALDDYKQTGSGPIRCRAKVEFGTQKREGRAKDRNTLTFTTLPPHTNPEKIGEQIKDALEKGKFDGVAEISDESDLTGDRVVVIAKPGVDAQLLARQLYTFTDCESKYSAKTLVIDGVKPIELSPVEICQRWFVWRMSRLGIQFEHESTIANNRHHVVEGLLAAIDKMDAIIKKIRASSNKVEAMSALMSAPFKFSRAQSDAILEMRLRQLTNLDEGELAAEKEQLDKRIAELDDLIKNKASRSVFIFKQMDEIAKRHGQIRRSSLVAPPTREVKIPTSDRSGAPRVSPVAKPRFMIVDAKKGIVTQAKGPRGAMVLDQKDKVIFIMQSGFFCKVHAAFKGPVAENYTPVVLAKQEREIVERKFLVVFTLNDSLKATVLDGADLARVTSKGKSFLPEGAELVHFGEGSYKVEFVSARKKPVVLDLSTKAGRPGGKGIKIAALTDLAN